MESWDTWSLASFTQPNVSKMRLPVRDFIPFYGRIIFHRVDIIVLHSVYPFEHLRCFHILVVLKRDTCTFSLAPIWGFFQVLCSPRMLGCAQVFEHLCFTPAQENSRPIRHSDKARLELFCFLSGARPLQLTCPKQLLSLCFLLIGP